MTKQGRGSRPLKEAFFVQVMTGDNSLIFFDETNNLGRKMPYDRPEATCAMRASADVVSFSLLKHTNRSRAQAVEQRLELPRGPLDRLERRAAALGEGLGDDEVVVEIEDEVHRLTITRDENGVATLETPVDVDDAVFDLPRGRLRLTILFRSPRGRKLVAAGFQGHVGKPESKETVVRVTAIALNLLTGLSVFRLVSGLETVNVPASPARYTAARPVIKDADRVRVQVPVRLWTDGEPQVVGQTTVDVELDLETANPISGRLLFHITAPQDAAEMFEPYRNLVADAALSLVTAYLGPDEVSELVYSIALGELGEGDLGRLREAVATITGLDVNPRQWVPFNAAATA